ncbi:MAG: hypothetical protein AMK73_03120 [Planctomycetes bacterium SM23_32]|nr:MAG: hypothetical protein AMK73_03120 [Planctomycetes bacterium SM23_32]
MGEATRPRPVNLICGVLAARREWLDAARDRLERALGPIDLSSDVWPFDQMDYYEAEMGAPLLRAIHSFAEMVAPDNLPAAKHTTNRLEKELADELPGAPRRPVNLDPGYVALGKLVLATTKDYAHRVYLGGGIYAESTLRWRDGAFEPWPWSYPDYATDQYRAFFARVRALYTEKLDAMD